MSDEGFTVGVEEEFFLVDAESRALRPRAERVFEAARAQLGEKVSLELNLAQIETGTAICTALDEVRREVGMLRAALMDVAADSDCRILPSGTHPFSNWIGQQITPKPRYEFLDDSYQALAWEQLVSGCHVHVCIPDDELAIEVMNRVRPWLATLRALTTNSPFNNGIDTGYASYRMGVFDRWPTTGAPPLLESRAAYDALVQALVDTDTVDDASRVYWDVRPSSHYSTIEFRVGDVLPSVDEVVMMAGLARAVTRVAARDAQRGLPIVDPPAELLRAARWRAARYGVSERLVDLRLRRAVPAKQLIDGLLEHVREDLEDHGEWDEVAEITRKVAAEGNGADRQRRVFAERGSHHDVVDDLVASAVPARA